MYYNSTQISDQIHTGYKRFYDILEAWEPPNMEMDLAGIGGTDKERKNFKLYQHIATFLLWFLKSGKQNGQSQRSQKQDK